MKDWFTIMLGIVLMSTVFTFMSIDDAYADECPLSEGIICGERDYTGGRTPNDVIHSPYVGGVTTSSFEETMQAFMVIMMTKAINDMEKRDENVGSNGCAPVTER
jgi:hypothetical protein